MSRRLLASAVLGLSLAAGRLHAQERGAAALGELVNGLGVTTRVLVIGAHPDDEDTRLIAWLQRGRHVETAYLSLTRGDGGQNLIGNELGEALGVVRTEELLSARRIDGARQYFARAYDFGFSKSADEAFRHWPHDSLLGDVMIAVRTFRPHVIVAIFTGTPRDGHGQHQASGILAREAYDLSADTVRFPLARFGPAWTVSKFYRHAGYGQSVKTIAFNVGEYSPLHGRSFAEIAAESRSQHKSQGFGALQRRGVSMTPLRREASRVNESTAPDTERSIFAGIDTTWSRVRRDLASVGPVPRQLDSLIAAIAVARKAFDAMDPDPMIGPLRRVYDFALRACLASGRGRCGGHCYLGAAGCSIESADGSRSLLTTVSRASAAIALAHGIAVEATVPRELFALGDSVRVDVTVYNRGRRPVSVERIGLDGANVQWPEVEELEGVVLPDSARKWTVVGAATSISQPWWLTAPRVGDLYAVAVLPVSEETLPTAAEVTVDIAGVGEAIPTPITVPVLYRYADAIRGDVSRHLAVGPAISVSLDRSTEFAPASVPIDRIVRVDLRPAGNWPREAKVTLELPNGLRADSATRTVQLPDVTGRTADDGTEQTRPAAGGSVPVRSVEFRVRGSLPRGRHTIAAVVESDSQTFADGYVPVAYEHIRTQRMYRPATIAIEAVDVKVPPGLSVAYIAGVGDNIAPMLQQLGVPLTMLDPAKLPTTDLARFRTIVVGPRAYEASDALVTHSSRLLDYVKAGGTMVVQYGQYEMMRPGMMPYPISLTRPADRVTLEDTPVSVTDPGSPILWSPNTITTADFAGWVQDRSLYMPRTFDERYASMLAMSDPGEPPNNGAVLVAAYGKGTYVYTSMAFFRQLPAGVPGAARLFVNLLSADQRAVRSRPPTATPNGMEAR